MSANPIGKYLPLTAVARPRRADRADDRERRASIRTSLHWPVLFRHRHSQTMESVTENLSSQGFYCFSQTFVASGEMLLCWLTLPTHDPSGTNGKIVLECDVRVVRSEAAPTDGLYGIACHIEDYRFSSGQMPSSS
jgi:hypothetical protein